MSECGCRWAFIGCFECDSQCERPIDWRLGPGRWGWFCGNTDTRRRYDDEPPAAPATEEGR